jgi:hypothetical protein
MYVGVGVVLHCGQVVLVFILIARFDNITIGIVSRGISL